MTLLYHIITFCWTFTHLYYPRQDDLDDGIEALIVRAISLPSNMGSLRKQFYFTMFYTATTVFAFMNSTIYWFITRQQDLSGTPTSPGNPQESGAPPMNSIVWGWDADIMAPLPDAPFSDLFGEGWHMAFNIFNSYATPAIIMTLEILLLNSIKRPFAIGSHLLGLIFFSGIYLGWAAVGRLTTGWFAFDWLDPTKVGTREAVIAYCMGFVILAPMMYILMQGFVGLREGLYQSITASRAVAAARDEEALES